MRRCQVATAGQEWRDAPLESVRDGQVFRLFEEDGSRVTDSDGCWRWRAVGDAYRDDDGRASVDAEGVPDSDVERAVLATGVYWPGALTARLPAPTHSRLRG